MSSLIPLVLFGVIIVLAITSWRKRRHRLSPGPGAAGAVYDFLNQDKRAALEIVVDERAAYHEPEDRDGDLPQFETRGRASDTTRADQ